jgi:hypothetical protein
VNVSLKSVIIFCNDIYDLVLGMSCHQNAGQNNNLPTASKSFENMTKFKFLGITVTTGNSIHEEIKSRLNSGNAYCHSIQNLLFSCLLSKSLKKKYIKL